MTNKQYNDYVENRSHTSPCFMNCIKAFFVGGFICLIGEMFKVLYFNLGMNNQDSLLFASITLIFFSSIFTGFGFFDKIAKFSGAGALVPITGFANSVTAPAIEFKTEGYITGVASKMFIIAGPVIVYGTFASFIYGVIYYFFLL